MGVMYWSLVSGENPETGTDFVGRLRAAQDLDLSPSQRLVGDSLRYLVILAILRITIQYLRKKILFTMFGSLHRR